MTTVVLGWDGLDAELTDEFGLSTAFGEEIREIATLTNPTIGNPHTYELWPSMITGLPPKEHGIRAETYTEGGSWSSSLLDAAATVSKHTVPEPIRWRVGRWIRGRGASFEFESLDYYRAHDIPTVFDGRRAFPLAIPNARSLHDDALGITMDRGAYLADFLDIGTDDRGRTVHSPEVAPSLLATRLEADVGQKLGAARAAYAQGYDLIWIWLGYVDTVGHVAPAIDDSTRWLRAGYETAAACTRVVRSWLDADDTLICVSDHGLQDGEHTDTAMIGSWPSSATEAVDDVLGVAAAVEAVTPQSNALSGTHDAAGETDSFDSVENRLAALGYLE